MIQSKKIAKPDIIGALASSLCLIHCVVTPLIFIVQTCSVASCADAPVWWQAIDYLFIVISFVAIFYASKNSSKRWILISLWSSWIILLLAILNKTFEVGLFPEVFHYLPALAIVGLHLYNYKYCLCKENKCCI